MTSVVKTGYTSTVSRERENLKRQLNWDHFYRYSVDYGLVWHSGFHVNDAPFAGVTSGEMRPGKSSSLEFQFGQGRYPLRVFCIGSTRIIILLYELILLVCSIVYL